MTLADKVFKVKPIEYRACLFIVAATIEDAIELALNDTYLSEKDNLVAKEVTILNRWHEPQVITTSSIREVIHVMDKTSNVVMNINKLRKVLAGEYADMFEVDISDIRFNNNILKRHEVLDTELNTIKINQEVIFDD